MNPLSSIIPDSTTACPKAALLQNRQKSPICCLPKVARSRPCSHPTTVPSKNMILKSSKVVPSKASPNNCPFQK
jgi:hypothetical protein